MCKIKKAIYLIKNKVNQRVYIGQSNNPERRFKEHCKQSSETSLIHRAIIKYGVENFTFKVLGWFEDYNEKEKYYINYYRSLAPNGYNILSGGNEPPHLKGDQCSWAKIDEITAERIRKDLLNFKIHRKQIVKKYNVSYDIIRHINEGDSWKDESLIYPLRPKESELNINRSNEAIKMLIETNLSQKEIGMKIGWGRSAITMINIGKNHRQETLIYPLRENSKKNKELLNL